jgi:hypothetical protein
MFGLASNDPSSPVVQALAVNFVLGDIAVVVHVNDRCVGLGLNPVCRIFVADIRMLGRIDVDRVKLEAEVRQLDPPDPENAVGTIQYYLNLRLNLSTDSLSDRIFASDPNIEGIQWSKTKNATDVYP